MAHKDTVEMATVLIEDLAANTKFMEAVVVSENVISSLTNECTDMVRKIFTIE